MSTDGTTAAVGTTAAGPSVYMSASTLSIYGPIDPDPNPNETPLHTSDYIDSDDEDLFNSIVDRIANQHHEQYPLTQPIATSKSFIDSLPTVEITSSSLKSCARSCSICKDDFAVQENVNSLPCKHVFHKDCILPWLSRSNSCPLCRYKLPVEQEQRPRPRPGPGSRPGLGPRPRLEPRPRPRPRPLMRYVVRLGNTYMDGWGEDYETGLDDAMLRSGYQLIRLPFSLPSSSSSTRMGQAATTGLSASPTNSEETVCPEFHVDGAASRLANGSSNVMLDEDGDTVMRDAYEN